MEVFIKDHEGFTPLNDKSAAEDLSLIHISVRKWGFFSSITQQLGDMLTSQSVNA